MHLCHVSALAMHLYLADMFGCTKTDAVYAIRIQLQSKTYLTFQAEITFLQQDFSQSEVTSVIIHNTNNFKATIDTSVVHICCSNWVYQVLLHWGFSSTVLATFWYNSLIRFCTTFNQSRSQYILHVFVIAVFDPNIYLICITCVAVHFLF